MGKLQVPSGSSKKDLIDLEFDLKCKNDMINFPQCDECGNSSWGWEDLEITWVFFMKSVSNKCDECGQGLVKLGGLYGTLRFSSWKIKIDGVKT